MLENEKRIRFQIAHVDFGPVFLHIGMLLAHQPAHVREKESSAGIVWISVRVCELMMHPVIPNPFNYAVLESHRF